MSGQWLKFPTGQLEKLPRGHYTDTSTPTMEIYNIYSLNVYDEEVKTITNYEDNDSDVMGFSPLQNYEDNDSVIS